MNYITTIGLLLLISCCCLSCSGYPMRGEKRKKNRRRKLQNGSMMDGSMSMSGGGGGNGNMSGTMNSERSAGTPGDSVPPAPAETTFQFRGKTTVQTDASCSDEDEALIFKRIDRFFEDSAHEFFNSDAYQEKYADYPDSEISGVTTEVDTSEARKRRELQFLQSKKKIAVEVENPKTGKRELAFRWTWGPFFTFGYCLLCPRDDSDKWWFRRDRRELLQGRRELQGGGGTGNPDLDKEVPDRFPRRAFADWVNEELSWRMNRLAANDRTDCRSDSEVLVQFEYLGSRDQDF